MASLHTIFDQQVTVRLLRQRLALPQLSDEDLILRLMAAESVDLHDARLTKMDGLDMCSELAFVDLSCNYIADLSVETLEMLPGLRVLNLYQNLLTRVPNIAFSRLLELNLAFNPLEQIDPAFLPGCLKKLSITGTDMPQAQISQVHDQITFFEATEMDFAPYNAVQTAIEDAGRVPALEAEVLQTRGKMAPVGVKQAEKSLQQGQDKLSVYRAKVQGLPTPEHVKYVEKRPTSKPTPIAASRKNASDYLAQTPYQLPYLALQQTLDLYTEEMSSIASYYQKALQEIDEAKNAALSYRIDGIIKESQRRAEDSFREVKNRIEEDYGAFEGRRHQMEELLQQKIDELKNKATNELYVKGIGADIEGTFRSNQPDER